MALCISHINNIGTSRSLDNDFDILEQIVMEFKSLNPRRLIVELEIVWCQWLNGSTIELS
jgi:hypothetical protein